jgi:hypothetical protein
MSPAALLVMGVLVTLTVGAAIALLIYAAILDGRHARAQKAAEHERGTAPGRPRIYTGGLAGR